MNNRLSLPILLTVAVLLYATTFAQTELPRQSTDYSMQLESGHDVLMLHSHDEIWSLDTDTGEKSLFYKSPTDVKIVSVELNWEQQILYVVQTNATDELYFRHNYDAEVWGINLATSESTSVFREGNITTIDQLPDDGSLLITFMDPIPDRYTEPTVRACILDIENSFCQYLDQTVAQMIYIYGTRYWIDNEHFLAANPLQAELFLVNAISGVSQRLLEDWSVFGFTPIHNRGQLIIAAQRNHGEYVDRPTSAWVYEFNPDTLELSTPFLETARFNSMERLALSHDNTQLLYSTIYGPTRFWVEDLSTGNRLMEIAEIVGLRWLAHSNQLIGAQMVDQEYRAIVRINPSTATVEEIFTYEGGAVSFLIVQ